jgi:HPr kinase/phosphorylase
LSATLKTGLLHASCVDFDGRGILIIGASGSGKSSLALACISLGAVLVGDDYVDLSVESDRIVATHPPNISGLIEVPRVGVLNCSFIERTFVALAIDMSQAEVDRLPPRRSLYVEKYEIPLIYGADIPYLHSVAYQLVTAGRADV